MVATSGGGSGYGRGTHQVFDDQCNNLWKRFKLWKRKPWRENIYKVCSHCG